VERAPEGGSLRGNRAPARPSIIAVRPDAAHGGEQCLEAGTLRIFPIGGVEGLGRRRAGSDINHRTRAGTLEAEPDRTEDAVAAKRPSGGGGLSNSRFHKGATK